MKIIVCLLLLVEIVLGELPPPYPPRNFRPSPLLRNYGPPNRPHTVYGPPPPPQPPRSNAEPLDPSFNQPPNPAKLISSNDFRYQTIRQPQTTYGPPNKQQFTLAQPQTTYGAPNKQIASQNFAAQQNSAPSVPSTSYGVPNKQIFTAPQQNLAPSNIYGVPNKQIVPQNFQPQQNSAPASLYGPPREQNQVPQNNYGVPDAPRSNAGLTIDAATLEEIRQLKQLIQKIEAQKIIQYSQSNRHGQSLPNKEPSNFRFSPSQQYLPVKEPENFRKETPLLFNEEQDTSNQNVNAAKPDLPTNYIPADATNSRRNNFDARNQGRNVDVQKVEVTQFGGTRSGNRNVGFSTTFRPDTNNEVDNKYIPPSPSSTENPRSSTASPENQPDDSYDTPQDEDTESPNVAIATAVSGLPSNDQQYYLLHPDGRYQRIVLPKSQSDKKNVVASNYQLYQNLQVDPNVLYTPLYTVLNK